MQNKLLKRSALLIVLIFGINTLASFFYWYNRMWWFDMMMHFLGGFFLSLVIVFVVEKYFSEFKDLKRPLLFFMALVGIMAIAWEFYELFIDIYFGSDEIHLLDSLSDICFDLAGGALGLLYIIKRYPFYKAIFSKSDII